MAEDLPAQILKQVEYYLSDVNLKRDSFFQKEMSKDDGFISVAVLLKCNKLKNLTTDGAQVMEALKASEVLVVSDCATKVKRKTAPPQLDADVAKRAQQREKRAAAQEDTSEDMQKAIEEKAAKACQERIVYKVCGVPEGVTWAEIKDAMKEHTNATGKIFIQHEDGATEAHVSAFSEGNAEKFAEAADKGDALKVKDSVVTMTQIKDADAQKAYWMAEFTKHPPKDVTTQNKKRRRDGKGGKTKGEPIVIGGVDFTSREEAKSKAMEIAKRNPDSAFEVLSGADKEFAAAILEFHPKAAEKKKGMKDIGVGVNPEFPSTRCFFVVQEGDNKVDFSYVKCIDMVPATQGSPAKKAKKE
jgi:hypothetical protein